MSNTNQRSTGDAITSSVSVTDEDDSNIIEENLEKIPTMELKMTKMGSS